MKNEQSFVEKYPKIFQDRTYEFSIGSGWYSIVNNACALIQWHIDVLDASTKRAITYNMALKYAIDDNDVIPLRDYYSTDTGLAGWARQQAVEDVQAAVYKDIPNICPQVIAVQIKEKFGTLRFYYDGGDEAVKGIVSMAEAMSGCTCEDCGKPGKRTGNGWVRTLCNDCNKVTT